MTIPGNITPDTYEWGSSEILAFFQKWTSAHIDNGVLRAYQQAMGWLATTFEPSEGKEVLRNSFGELPLVVGLGFITEGEHHTAVGRSIHLERVNPLTGEIAPQSLFCIGFLMEESGRIQNDKGEDNLPFFTSDMLQAIVDQLRDQDTVGIPSE